jgi:hypothetical protein
VIGGVGYHGGFGGGSSVGLVSRCVIGVRAVRFRSGVRVGLVVGWLWCSRCVSVWASVLSFSVRGSSRCCCAGSASSGAFRTSASSTLTNSVPTATLSLTPNSAFIFLGHSISVWTSSVQSTPGFFQNPSRLKLGSPLRSLTLLVRRIRRRHSNDRRGVSRTRSCKFATLPGECG